MSELKASITQSRYRHAAGLRLSRSKEFVSAQRTRSSQCLPHLTPYCSDSRSRSMHAFQAVASSSSSKSLIDSSEAGRPVRSYVARRTRVRASASLDGVSPRDSISMARNRSMGCSSMFDPGTAGFSSAMHDHHVSSLLPKTHVVHARMVRATACFMGSPRSSVDPWNGRYWTRTSDFFGVNEAL